MGNNFFPSVARPPEPGLLEWLDKYARILTVYNATEFSKKILQAHLKPLQRLLHLGNKALHFAPFKFEPVKVTEAVPKTQKAPSVLPPAPATASVLSLRVLPTRLALGSQFCSLSEDELAHFRVNLVQFYQIKIERGQNIHHL